MKGSYFNSEQQANMAYLSSLPPEKTCWCGWCEVGRCDTPNPCPPGSTLADRLKVTCQCGGYPGKPGTPMYHRVGCAKREAV
ncbi:hypothetical protein HDG42_000112 [Paraburkholderia sp. JPY171]|nr:hypothetical protein [Paraburkholderia atlantica]